MAVDAAALLSLAVWLYLIGARGGFWRVRVEPAPPLSPGPAPSVVAVIPARNEADVVARSVASLAAQAYPGRFHIVLVDDASTDGTAERARAVASPQMLTVIRVAPLESGWTGKLWAVAEGIRYAEKLAPDFLLLTDADIEHPSGNVTDLVARAEASRLDLVSYMAMLQCGTLAERALIPAFVFFFFLLYPPAWIANSKRATAGAAGGCMMVRRSTLERAGGVAAVRNALIDDCALASAVKRQGGRVWLGLSPATQSLRVYATFAEIARMISRTAFTQLNHSALLLAGTVAGLAFTYLLPPVQVFVAPWRPAIVGGLAWLAMSIAYLPVVRFYRRSPLWAPLLPLVALFYMGATVWSAVEYWRGAGGQWKGRVQDSAR